MLLSIGCERWNTLVLRRKSALSADLVRVLAQDAWLVVEDSVCVQISSHRSVDAAQ